MSTSKNNRRKELAAQNKAKEQPDGEEVQIVIDDLVKVDPSLRNIGARNLQKIAIAVQRTEHFSGPLPRPDHLEQYAVLIENGAERIMKQSEDQTDHRIRSERNIVNWTLFQSIIGQLIAAALAVAAMYLGYKMVMDGHDWAGGVMLGVPVMTMVVAFLKYSNHHRK